MSKGDFDSERLNVNSHHSYRILACESFPKSSTISLPLHICGIFCDGLSLKIKIKYNKVCGWGTFGSAVWEQKLCKIDKKRIVWRQTWCFLPKKCVKSDPFWQLQESLKHPEGIQKTECAVLCRQKPAIPNLRKAADRIGMFLSFC